MSEAILVAKSDAAELLGVSLRTVDYLISRGELAAKRIGRRVLIPRAELERFAETPPNPPSPTLACAGQEG
jgi:excisionase family DNA binding protein